MNDARLGGGALVAGTVGLLVTMGLHPHGHELADPGRFEHAARVTAAVHALGIASMPLLFLGGIALTRRTDAPNRLALAALVVYGAALIAGALAATVSGLIVPDLVGSMLEASSEQRAGWEQMLEFSHLLNQACARLLVLGESVAIGLWSLALLRGSTRSSALARGAGVYGLVSAGAVFLLVASGHVRLDVHGFGAIVLAQGLWTVLVGVFLWRVERLPAGAVPA